MENKAVASKQDGAQAWFIAILLTLGGIIAAASVMKINPCASLIMEDFGIGEGAEGMLLSVCSIVGLIIAIPAGGLMNKFGPRVLGMVSMIVTIIGGVIGSLATSYTMMLVGRVLEGFAFGTWSVLGPVFINAWFSPKKRGLPMGIFAIWVGWCMLVIFKVANLFIDRADASSWHNVWWLTVIAGIIYLFLFFFFARLPKGSEAEAGSKQGSEASSEKASSGSSLSALKSVPVICILIMFAIFSYAQQVITAYTSTYNMTLGVDVITANSITTYWTLGNVIAGLIIGAVCNKFTKLTSRAVMILFAACCSLVAYITIFRYTTDIAQIYLLVFGMLCNMYTAIAYNTIPDLVKDGKQLGMTLAFAAFTSKIGHVCVATGGYAIEFGGYSFCSLVLTVCGVVYVACAIVLLVNARKLDKVQEVSAD